MKVRPYFLIAIACPALHVSYWYSLAAMFGYYVCERVDRWLAQRSRDRVWERTITPQGQEVDLKEERIVVRITEFIRRLE